MIPILKLVISLVIDVYRYTMLSSLLSKVDNFCYVLFASLNEKTFSLLFSSHSHKDVSPNHGRGKGRRASVHRKPFQEGSQVLNTLNTGRLFHCYILDESISRFRVSSLFCRFYFIFDGVSC